MTVHLPIELIERILDLLRFDTHTSLKQCALVHTEWLSSARSHLFSAIHFGKLVADEVYTDAFQRRTESPPRIGTFASYVAVIRVGNMDCAQLKRALCVARAMGPHFDHPRLQLSFITSKFAIPQFVDFLACFPHLNRIDLVESDVRGLFMGPPIALPLTYLRELAVGPLSHRLWTECILALAPPLCVTRLSISVDSLVFTREELQQVLRSIHLLASTLEHLEIDLHCGRDMSLNLFALPHLRTLKVHFPLKFGLTSENDRVELLNGLPHFLTTTTPAYLETIHIISHFTYLRVDQPRKNYPSCDWAAMDEALSLVGNLKVQWDIIFMQDSNNIAIRRNLSHREKEEVPEMLRSKLPKCVARGVLGGRSTTEVEDDVGWW